MQKRTINRLVTIPPVGPGFGGPAHSATAIIPPGDFPATDPFYLMMDDRINRSGPFGGAHPHAGLETVTFVIDGTMEDVGGRLGPGDVEWMTAGSGIVHAEDTAASEGMRLFQLWVPLPEGQRHITPRVQILSRARMPVRREPGVEAVVYSGRSGEAQAATVNVGPVTLVDVRLDPGATFSQDVPSSYNGFVLVLEGEVAAGDPSVTVSAGQVGWTSPITGSGASTLVMHTGVAGARVLFYAGQPQNVVPAAQGPFLAGTPGELDAYFAAYRQGLFSHASTMRTAHV